MAIAAVPSVPPHAVWGNSDVVCNSLEVFGRQKFEGAPGVCW